MKKKPVSTIFWTLLSVEDWSLYIAATSKGLCYVGSPNQPVDEMVAWVKQHFPSSELVQDDEAMRPYATELREYFQGLRNSFTIPLDWHGTPFQREVWNALCEIPYGETRSYTEIAERIDKKAAVRAVGAAIGANPLLITVPCHRVIGKNGSLTGYRGGLEMKKKLLQGEQEFSREERSRQHA
ncbi:methylated-DNA--[protein]-cysteine S-methyltransferase [Brevibacillus panacihumi]|uniref:Methylated-DNA--protein-cysteine methyltransferase n=1 Tax=Brevibacillus panacihumi TaxID=497735 RepID=A0A3M8CPD2_9BACL|nr:methylated-DNA--[protein]-cysteine S-methyltransferase [Brevibacillus panacihumi]RNB77514.1 methylated-DNA--[protein]-cysteine S-methyltransferase [Brevibacillus panacihumi]